MPPLPSIKELPHLGRIVQRELLSVALPGALVLIEIWLLVASPGAVRRHGGFLKYASSQTSHVNTGILVIAVLLGAISAYGIGLVSRMYIWRLFEHFPRSEKLSLGPEITDVLRNDFGSQAVDQVLARHIPLRNALLADVNPDVRIPEPDSGAARWKKWLRRDRKPDLGARGLLTTRDEYLSYCKGWLRLHRPGLAVDHLETQINFLVTLVPPLLLSSFVIARHTAWRWFPAALLITGFAAMCFVHLSWVRRKWEPIDAVRYFFLAHWYDDAEHPAAPFDFEALLRDHPELGSPSR